MIKSSISSSTYDSKSTITIKKICPSESEEDSDNEPSVTRLKLPKKKTFESEDDEDTGNVDLTNDEIEDDDDNLTNISEVSPLKIPLVDSGDSDDSSEFQTDVKSIAENSSKWSFSDHSQNINEDKMENKSFISETDSLSLSSLGVLVEEQIESFFIEYGLKRPRKQPKALYENILQHGIEIRDISLDDNEMEELDLETENFKDLSLDELIFKMNFFE